MDIADLKETAALARLTLNEAELTAAFPAFEEMLGFFAAMQAADGLAVNGQAANGQAADGGAEARTFETMVPPRPAEFFRPDNPPHSLCRVNPENLLNNAGERDGRFIVAPNVL
jgi:aspartyl-tRNA(Asn)/glutamyl-tRNA(Gln) amidotransferase subunit C